MARGTGMSTTRRRNRRNITDPEALAARLPDDCRSFDGYDTPAQFHVTAARIAAWLDTQAPGTAKQLTYPVMQAAGLSATDWYKAAFNEQAAENRKALPRPPETDRSEPLTDG